MTTIILLTTISDNLIDFQIHTSSTIRFEHLLTRVPKKKIFGEKFKLQDFFYKFEYPSRVYINIQKYKITELNLIQEQLEYIYTNKDNFIKKFNPNQNNFEIVKFNNFLTLSCFTIFNIIGIYSFSLLINFGFIQQIYFLEIIFYLIYFNFFY